MNDSWNLLGSNRREPDEWALLYQRAQSWSAAWADVEGFHLETMPPQPPVTTHLWAWTSRHWLRVRIDGRHWWAALLTAGTPDIRNDLWGEPESVAPPSVSPIRHWANEREAKQYRGTDEIRHRNDFIQLTPLRRTTAPFVGHISSHPHPEQIAGNGTRAPRYPDTQA
jgi:hypothetical protein